MLEREREHLAATARRLAAEGLVRGGSGNVSTRAGERIAISAAGAPLGSLALEQVVVVDIDGERLDGDLRPSSELRLHLGVYRRFAAGAVAHTHSESATALSCVLPEIPVIHYQMLLLGGAIRVAPYATFGSPALAQATLSALEGRTAALMANHGAIVHGADLEVVVERAAARMAVRAVPSCGLGREPAGADRGRAACRRQRRVAPGLRSDEMSTTADEVPAEL